MAYYVQVKQHKNKQNRKLENKMTEQNTRLLKLQEVNAKNGESDLIKIPVPKVGRMTLKEIKRLVNANKIVMPPFQREYNWGLKELTLFSNSLFSRDSLSAIDFWEEFVDLVIRPRMVKNYTKEYGNNLSNEKKLQLTDGGHRVNALLSISEYHATGTNEYQNIQKSDLLKLKLNLTQYRAFITGELKNPHDVKLVISNLSQSTENKEEYVTLVKLFDTGKEFSNLESELAKYFRANNISNHVEQRALVAFVKKFVVRFVNNYDLVTNTYADLPRHRVIKTFTDKNGAGKMMSDMDLSFAVHMEGDFVLKDQINILVRHFKSESNPSLDFFASDKKAQDVLFKQFVYLYHGKPERPTVTELRTEDLKTFFPEFEQTMKEAINYFKFNLGQHKFNKISDRQLLIVGLTILELQRAGKYFGDYEKNQLMRILVPVGFSKILADGFKDSLKEIKDQIKNIVEGTPVNFKVPFKYRLSTMQFFEIALNCTNKHSARQTLEMMRLSNQVIDPIQGVLNKSQQDLIQQHHVWNIKDNKLEENNLLNLVYVHKNTNYEFSTKAPKSYLPEIMEKHGKSKEELSLWLESAGIGMEGYNAIINPSPECKGDLDKEKIAYFLVVFNRLLAEIQSYVDKEFMWSDSVNSTFSGVFNDRNKKIA